MTKSLRLAFSGPSGTGKTTLASWVADTFHLPLCPIGARSVASSMGFESPYDVDRAGRRTEFQRKLLEDKLTWEREHDAFVTDRSTLDVLTYWTLHDVLAIKEADQLRAYDGFGRYTHLVYCPESAFISLNDPVLVASRTYHRLYERLLNGLRLDQLDRQPHPRTLTLLTDSLDKRKESVAELLKLDA